MSRLRIQDERYGKRGERGEEGERRGEMYLGSGGEEGRGWMALGVSGVGLRYSARTINTKKPRISDEGSGCQRADSLTSKPRGFPLTSGVTHTRIGNMDKLP